VRIVVVYPALMGTYGDGGNAVALRERLARRGLTAEITAVDAPGAVPRGADIYLLGGAENASQTTASRLLIAEGSLRAAVDAGAVVLGICGGYQILGEHVTDANGVTTPGLGLLDVRSSPLPARAVGDIAVTPVAAMATTGSTSATAEPGLEPANARASLPVLVGFENHAYGTSLGPAASPLGTVRGGIGNGLDPDASSAPTEGAVQGTVIGTYLHGPVLAINPALADHLLAPFVRTLEPLDDSVAAEVRRVRMPIIDDRARNQGRRS
jgi:CobQ-like glutamine amidotransferase family enzyme